jgi:hypothetical protein
MYSPFALLDLRSAFSAHSTLLPVAGGVMCGFAFAIFRGGIARILPSSRDSQSLMNFSSRGTLRCVCGVQHPEGMLADRRQFCRSCGCEVVAPNEEMLNKYLSPKEIKAMTKSLRRAAIRASHLELPPSITTVEELHRYLDSPEPKNERTPPTRPTQIQQPTLH